jgi:hypothetical protein
MNIDANDLEERMNCAIDSFISIYKKGNEWNKKYLKKNTISLN